jgi:hypothetical protein
MSSMSRSGAELKEVEGCIKFDYEELRAATNSFDPKPVSQGGFKLGEGGFGPVFRGILKFTEVAIKILRNTPKVSYWGVW